MSRLADSGRSGSAQEALERAHRARQEVLEGGKDMVLSVTRIQGAEARVVGRFSAEASALRRETGGPPWVLRPGTHFVRIALAHASVLLPTPPDKILNRNVRPLLAALRKCGCMAMYGGRDFVSADGDIVALLAWARGAGGEVVLDAAIATEASVLEDPEPAEIARAHLGKSARPFAAPALGARLVGAYLLQGEQATLAESPLPPVGSAGPELARVEVPIGRLSLHRGGSGALELAGDFFADDELVGLLSRAPPGLREVSSLADWLRRQPVVIEGIGDWPRVLAELSVRAG